jgi:acetylornithine aminotransferase/acetylornithine/N-succinyldiaminopimelate aminotransferase
VSDRPAISGDEARALEQRYGIATYSQLPHTIVRGEGCWVWNSDGRRFLDLYGGHAVALTGHCHPRVVSAVQEQAGRLLFYSNAVSSDVRAQALRDLAETAPDGISRSFLCNSGAEANEAAIKMARRTTGRRKVVSMEGGFHGRTMGALSATQLGHYLDDYAPGVPDHVFVPFGDLDAVRDVIDGDTASVMLEPIQSMGGMRTADGAYLRGLRALCDEHGTLLHFDEVQTGPGRTGTWWYGDHFDVVPDLISTAKGLGSGVPVGAVLVADGVADRIGLGDQGTTFGGGMLAAVAVSATLAVIRDEGLLENATRRGSEIREGAGALPGVTGFRGQGMLLGIVLDRPAKDVVAALREKDVLTGATPGDPHVLRILAPLVVGDEEVSVFLEALEEVLRG